MNKAIIMVMLLNTVCSFKHNIKYIRTSHSLKSAGTNFIGDSILEAKQYLHNSGIDGNEWVTTRLGIDYHQDITTIIIIY